MRFWCERGGVLVGRECERDGSMVQRLCVNIMNVLCGYRGSFMRL